MTSGRASRDKGNRAERAIVQFLQDRGFLPSAFRCLERPAAHTWAI